MPTGIHYLLNDEHLSTGRAMLTLGQACFSTGGGYGFVDHRGMSKCLNHLLLHKNLTTYRAMLALGQACFGTSRCYSRIKDLGMSFSRKCLRFQALTAGANKLLLALFGTGGSLRDNPGDTHAGVLIRGIFVPRLIAAGCATRTALAATGTYAVDVVMSQRGNGFLSLIYLVTSGYGTNPAPGQTALGASGFYGVQDLTAVMLGANHGVDHLLIAAHVADHGQRVDIFDLRTVVG